MDSTSTTLPQVVVDDRAARRIRGGHPWAYANEVTNQTALREVPSGALTMLRDGQGRTLALAGYNRHSLIAARVMARRGELAPGEPIGRAFFARRIAAAVGLRERFFDRPYYRAVHAEADGLPGLVIDRHGDVVVLQFNAAAMALLEDEVIAAVREVLVPATLVLRNDSAAREHEGLERTVRVHGSAIDGPVVVEENGVRFRADALHGQKTGWFYDQRPSRSRIAGLAAGARVLDLYSHTGGFALRAAASGAESVTAVDSSGDALDLARRAADENGLDERCIFRRSDVFAELERLNGGAERFDIVVADPPAFVKSKKALTQGLRGYYKLARAAQILVRPGGFLYLASCSHHVDRDAFMGEVRKALGTAGRSARIVAADAAGPDHPVHPQLPESEYLKSVLLQLD
ncbi:MAG: class I SAM-dependent rRNA methyltransferase [Acetobacterales bacterium]